MVACRTRIVTSRPQRLFAMRASPWTNTRRSLGGFWICCIFEPSPREYAIAKAHMTTYEWIFTNPDVETETRPYDSFRAWLQGGRGIYWISGKPGSGKSTLMKFITNHENTRIMLQKWSGSKQHVVASFFFWRAGTSMQRSYTGLLRTLLSEILEQH